MAYRISQTGDELQDILNEAPNTEQAVSDLQGEVDAINAKIPSEATAENPLVDSVSLEGVYQALEDGKADVATTLSGYGITDAYTKAQVDNIEAELSQDVSALSGTVEADVQNLAQNYYNKAEVNGLIIPQDTEPIVGPLPSEGETGRIYRVPGADSYSDYAWNGTEWVLLATHNIDAIWPQIGYYTCSTAAGTAAKTVSASGYILATGGNIRIKMTYANTADSATLNINSTGAKALYYEGAQASSTNSWEAGEVVTVYYDGTRYQCAIGGGSADMVKYDNSESGLNAENVQMAIDEIAEDVSTYRQILDNCYHESTSGGTDVITITNSDLESGTSSWTSNNARIRLKKASLIDVNGKASLSVFVPYSAVSADPNIDRVSIPFYNSAKELLSSLDMGWLYFNGGSKTIDVDLTESRYDSVAYIGIYFGANSSISPSSIDASGITFSVVSPTIYTTKAIDEVLFQPVVNKQSTHEDILADCYHYREGESSTQGITSGDIANIDPTFASNSQRVSLIKASLIDVSTSIRVTLSIPYSAVSADPNIDRVTMPLYNSDKTYLSALDLRWFYFNGETVTIVVDLDSETYTDVAYVGLYIGSDTSISLSSIDTSAITYTLISAVEYTGRAVDEISLGEFLNNTEVETPYDWDTQVNSNRYYGNKIVLNEYTFTYDTIGSLQSGVNSRQGGAVYGNYLFQFHNTLENICVFDLSTSTNVDKLTLTANPSCHAGSGGFSTTFYDVSDPFPLLYISSMDERRIFVYRITGEIGSLSISKIQTIYLSTSYFLPNIAVDNETEKIVVFGYTQNSWDVSTNNDSVVMTFPIPSHTSGDVTIGDFDNRFKVPFIWAEQGAFATLGKLYLSFGNTSSKGGIIVFDYINKKVENLVWLRAVGSLEPEACCKWGEYIIFTTQSGVIYKLSF